MITRLVIPLVATTALLLVTFVTWNKLSQEETSQFAHIANLESYSTRNSLERSVNTVIRALHDAEDFWSTYARLPRDQWADDAEIELSHFKGLEFILWSDTAASVRYVHNPNHPTFDYRPSDDEWMPYQSLFAKAQDMKEDQILGPTTLQNGEVVFDIFFVSEGEQEGSILVARIDASKFLGDLLENDSPGYAITVIWKGQVIYQRDKAHPGLPPELHQEGEMETFMGGSWEVILAPTTSLVESMKSPTSLLILLFGVVNAFLVGLLIYFVAKSKKGTLAALDSASEISVINEGLEKLVAKRTLELQRRSSDLVMITDSVGHDLRNPLNAISANNQLLEQQFGDKLGAGGTEILEQSFHCINNMTDILDRLLNLSQVSTSKFVRQRVDMKKLAASIMEELVFADPKPPVEFILGEIPDANAEPVMVTTLITNLLSNALKYSRSRSVREIEFSAKREKGVVTYFIKDNGRGFNSAHAKVLFEAFERFDYSDEIEGLGLGLDIANRVVERHEGVIWAEGSPGNGATFYFTLGNDSSFDQS